MTGPQTTLLAPIGDDDDDPYGETTRGWLRAAQDQHQAEAQDAIDSAVTGNAILPARSHARTRRSWLPPRFRRQAPGPVRTTLIADRPAPAAAQPAPEPRDPDRTVGYVGPEHLQHGTQHEPSSIAHLYAELAHEAPPAGDVPPGTWDTPQNREPVQAAPVYVPAPAPWQLPVPAEVSSRRMAALEYPSWDEATRDRYAAVMRQVDIYTGTRTAWGQPSAWSWLPAGRSDEMAITWGWQRESLLALPAGTGVAA